MRMVRQSRKDLYETAKTKDLVVFGAGMMALRFFNKVDILPKVKFICDNSEDRTGTRLYGLDIRPADALKTVSPDKTAIIIASNSARSIEEQVRTYGDFDLYFARVLSSDHTESVSCELYDNQGLTQEVETLLDDDLSKRIYREVVRRRTLYGECDFSDLVVKGDKEYIFPPMYAERPPDHEMILDCGAYTGDTLKLFVNFFDQKVDKIWAFECGGDQLKQLRDRAAYLRERQYCPEIIISPYAVSDRNETVHFCQTEKLGGSFVAESGELANSKQKPGLRYQVESVALDEFIPAKEPITFIKMDIEGGEYNALQGAAQLIKRHKPKLAVSLYHSGSDFFRIPLLIKKLVPEYKFAVRHHKKNHVDTDLYAWI